MSLDADGINRGGQAYLLCHQLGCWHGEGEPVKSRRNQMLLGLTLASIMLTVIPSTFCLAVLAVGNLSSGANFVQILLWPLPAMVLIGGMVGLGTGIILPKMWWLVVIETQLGWFAGLLAIGLLGEMLQNTPHGNLVSYAGHA